MATRLLAASLLPRPVPAGCGHAAEADRPAASRLGRQCCQQRQRQRRRWRQAASGGDFDPLQPSKLFDSPFFMQEVEEMYKGLDNIGGMLSKFGDYDIEGKKLFVDHMEAFAERLQTVNARLELTDDPLGNEILRMQRVQMLEACTSLGNMMEQYKQMLSTMREMIALEESTADQAAIESLRRQWRDQFAWSAGFNPQEFFSSPADAAVMRRPDALKVFMEVMENPAALEKYRDDKDLYGFLQKVLAQVGGGGAKP